MKIGRLCVLGALLVVMVGGCATPATQVKVKTMSVEEAWNGSAEHDFSVVKSREVKPSLTSTPPVPIISAPDVRLAYIVPWKDEAGNYHYGGWVAVQVNSPKWLLPDGSVDPIDGRGAKSSPARAR